MKRFILTAVIVSLAAPAFAQSAAEKTGVNSLVGIAPTTQDFVNEAASSDMFEIEASKLCGCYCCMQTFPPDEIVAWTGIDASSFDNPDAVISGTAVCPRCGSESMIGDKSGYTIDANFLGRMNEAWFQRTIIRKPAPKR